MDLRPWYTIRSQTVYTIWEVFVAETMEYVIFEVYKDFTAAGSWSRTPGTPKRGEAKKVEVLIEC